MNKEVKIEAKNLSIGYKQKATIHSVFNELNFSFSSGDLVGIIGNNGLGKSTLIKSLCGLQEIIDGTVLINNHPQQTISANNLAKELSVVLTEKVYGFNLTVNDLVSMGRMPYTNLSNSLTETDLNIVSDCIKLCGIEGEKNKQLQALSDGLYQKAMIAMSLARETPIMLFDEPTAFLDYTSKHHIFSLLSQLVNEKNKCVIISSHDIDLLLKYCNKILFMQPNNVYEVILTENYKTEDLFEKVTGLKR